MKKQWTSPRILVQEIEANEYVAACVQGIIACAIPGYDNMLCDGNSPVRNFNYDVTWNNNLVKGDGLDHGLCGEETPISFNSDTASGFETNHGTIDYERVITNVSGYTLTPGVYNVTWNSSYRDSPIYTHYGKLNITNIDDEHPNRS